MIGPGNRGAVAQTELSTTNTIKRINDGTYIRDVLPIAQAIGTTADANGNYLANGSTSVLVDDAGLGNTAVWGDVSQPPTTLAGYGITNAQETLGSASGTEILFQSSGGGPYWAPQYGSNINLAATPSQSTVTLPSTTGSYVQIGNTLYIPNPNQEISLLLFFKGNIEFSGITSATEIDGRFNVSTDGSGTYVTYGGNYGYAGVSGTWIFPYSDMAILANITPTGDIYIEYQMERTSGTSGTLYCGSQAIGAIILPQSLYSVVGPTLAVTVPSTATASCTSSGSSCSAPTSITASPTGGKPPYTYSWSVTSGAGTITSGSTAQTVYVSETGTTASPANTLNTTYECQVTDSASSTANASCTVTSSFLLGYNSITVSLSETSGSCAANSGTCGATGYDTATATGGNESYTYSWSITSQTGSGASITAGATSSKCTVEGTSSVPSSNTVSMKCIVNDTRNTGAVTATNSVFLSYRQIS